MDTTQIAVEIEGKKTPLQITKTNVESVGKKNPVEITKTNFVFHKSGEDKPRSFCIVYRSGEEKQKELYASNGYSLEKQLTNIIRKELAKSEKKSGEQDLNIEELKEIKELKDSNKKLVDYIEELKKGNADTLDGVEFLLHIKDEIIKSQEQEMEAMIFESIQNEKKNRNLGENTTYISELENTISKLKKENMGLKNDLEKKNTHHTIASRVLIDHKLYDIFVNRRGLYDKQIQKRKMEEEEFQKEKRKFDEKEYQKKKKQKIEHVDQKAKAEKELKAKTEEELKAKVDEELKAKAEEELKAKVEEEFKTCIDSFKFKRITPFYSYTRR